MSKYRPTSFQHDFMYNYGEGVRAELAEKVMRDVYKGVKYKKALEEIVRQGRGSLDYYLVAKEALK